MKKPDPVFAKRLLLERAAAMHDSRSAAAFARNLRGLCAENARLRAPRPLGDFSGADEIAKGFWAPLRRAFPDLERRFDILISVSLARRQWTCAAGHFVGTFAGIIWGFRRPAGRCFCATPNFAA